MDTECSPNVNNIEFIAGNSTVPLSLRIGESLRAIFDAEAKKSGLSTSALISTILDSCADSFIAGTVPMPRNNLQILEHHLETKAKKAYILDFETLLADTIMLHPFAYTTERICPTG